MGTSKRIAFSHAIIQKLNLKFLGWQYLCRHFTVTAPPEYLPIFPYNYLTAAPSYRADETGQIRMIRVRNKNHLCPADAPVIMKINEQDLQQAWHKIYENQAKEQMDAHQTVGTGARGL